MTTKFENIAVLRCVDTGESEIVNVHDFTPRVQLSVDLFVGTKNYRRMILKYDNKEFYHAEVYGRNFTSRGPKIISERAPTKPRSKFDNK